MIRLPASIRSIRARWSGVSVSSTGRRLHLYRAIR